ncbi:hypothetical protein BH09PLA1_BH09PLA1_23440 [soil metagenome]
MRIALGIATLYDVAGRFSVLRLFYSDDGLSPRAIFLNGSLKWQTLFSISGSAGYAGFLLAVQAVAALMFTIGYQTRITTVAMLALQWSLINRNPTLSHGGHNLEVWLLIWSLFLPLSAVASVDAYTARASDDPPRPPRVRRACSVASMAILVQLGLMYWNALSVKTNVEWRSDFTAVYYFLNSHLATPLGHAIGQSTDLCHILTMMTVFLEFFGPVFALLTFSLPRLRSTIVLIFMSFHLCLVATMYVGTFSMICMAAWLLYLPPQAWNFLGRVALLRILTRVWNALLGRIARVIEFIPPLAVRTISPGPRRRFVQAGVGALFAYILTVNLVGFLPSAAAARLGPLARLPRIKQSWGVMDVAWKYFQTVVLEVELADGSIHTIDATSVPDGSFARSLPPTQRPEEYWTWEVWRAETTFLIGYRSILLLASISNRPEPLAAYCDYHRRKWNEFHPSPEQQVKSIRLYAVIFETRAPHDHLNQETRSAKEQLYVWPESATTQGSR